LAFSVYGETLIIIVQNVMIIFLIWNYNTEIGFVHKTFIFGAMGAYIFALFSGSVEIPEETW